MDEQAEGSLRLACVADQSVAAAALYEALVALFPGATVARVDTDVERVLPEPVHCAVIDAAVHDQPGIDVLRRLRASGFSGAAVVLIDESRPNAAADATSAVRVGARWCPLTGNDFVPLGTAVADALRVHDDGGDASPSNRAVRAVRHTQRMLAAGELAMRLQHSLNNPLAALLAEAQLLDLEPLPPDHKESVERIIELTRRVIGVVRGLDGIGKA